MSNNILGGVASAHPVKPSTLEETYRETMKKKVLAQQYAPTVLGQGQPLINAITGQMTGAVQNPAPTAHDVLRVERATPQKLIFTVEKIDNGFVVTAYEDTVTSGISTELFKSFIEDPTNLGEVAIKALAIAGLSK